MQASVVIVGGGVMGAATACFLARDHGVHPLVLERDPTYMRASSALSASSIRQQFASEVNIRLSQASLAFLRRVGDELAVGGDRPGLGLVEPGYLYLAAAEGAAQLAGQHRLQRACEVDVALLDAVQLRARFPWLNTDGVALGSLGLCGEGWFDGPALHQAFRRKAIACGARFVAADVDGIDTCAGRAAALRCSDGRRIEAGHVLIAAGAWSAALAAHLGFELPVRARKRDVFVLDSPARLPGCPLVIDTSGLWFRPEGTRFLCGAAPRGDDLDDVPLEHIDHGLFDEVLWPALAHRVPAFEALRVTSAWAGYYEMNTFDCNGLAGALPGWQNVSLACGFSGHGMQQAPAVGRAMAEWIALGRFDSFDLSPLTPARLAEGRPLPEDNVI